MNWDNIRYFLAVAESGSVAGAARIMNVKHPTVIRKIDQLEQEVGAKLFHRLQSGYELSDSGIKILPLAEQIQSDTDSMCREVQYADEEAKGPVALTLPSGGTLDLSDLLAQFVRRNPLIQLTVKEQREEIDMGKLHSDIALRVTDSPPENLVGRKLGSFVYRAYVNEDSFQASYLSMKNYSWISHTSNPGQLSVLEDWLVDAVGEEKIGMQTNAIAIALKAVQSGIGACILPIHIAEKEEGLIELPFTKCHFERELWLLTHPNHRGIERVRALMTYLLDQVPRLLSSSL